MNTYVNFSSLVGKTIAAISVDGDCIHFECTDGSEYVMEHDQDCCEWVSIDDIDGDIQRLIGSEVVVAEELVSRHNPPNSYDDEDSFTWTFYVLRTNLDSVTIRWFGTSNGYYSESVDFKQTK